jgi:hypothetical protein
MVGGPPMTYCPDCGAELVHQIVDMSEGLSCCRCRYGKSSREQGIREEFEKAGYFDGAAVKWLIDALDHTRRELANEQFHTKVYLNITKPLTRTISHYSGAQRSSKDELRGCEVTREEYDKLCKDDWYYAHKTVWMPDEDLRHLARGPFGMITWWLDILGISKESRRRSE